MTLYAYAVPERGRTCMLLVIKSCPFCRKRHSHGGGPLDGDPRELLGSRVPHCLGAAARGCGGMYWLTDDPALQGKPVPDAGGEGR